MNEINKCSFCWKLQFPAVIGCILPSSSLTTWNMSMKLVENCDRIMWIHLAKSGKYEAVGFFPFAINMSTTDTVFEMCFPLFLYYKSFCSWNVAKQLQRRIHWMFTAHEYLICRDISMHYASSIKTQPLSPLRSTLLADSLVPAMPLQIFQVVFCCRQHD